MKYTFKHSVRSRHVRISVKRTGEVIVTAPRFISQKLADKFVSEHLDWIQSKIKKFESMRVNTGVVKIDHPGGYLKNKEAARIFVSDKLKKINEFYHFSFKRVSIKNTATRWGSCSKKGNLNFNYKIMFLPDDLANYIITHELCHLKELNHSKRFWQLVEKSIPNWQILRRELKQNIW